MSKALSVDLRVRVLQAVAVGASHREAADRFGVSAASVSAGAIANANKAHLAHWRSAGTVDPSHGEPGGDDHGDHSG